MQALRSPEDASSLAALLHACVSSLHAHTDAAKELSPPHGGTASTPDGTNAAVDDAAVGGASAADSASPAAARLSPLSACALSRLERTLSAGGADDSALVVFLCSSLAAVGEGGSRAHAVLLRRAVGRLLPVLPTAAPPGGTGCGVHCSHKQ